MLMYDVNGGGQIILAIRISAETIGAAIWGSISGIGGVLIIAASVGICTILGAIVANAIEDAI